jgi:hypothetical protein
MSPIRFSSFGGYRRFTTSWWFDVLSHFTPLRVHTATFRDNKWWRFRSYSRIGWPGFCHDIYTYWHRARYGWAPRDVWNLNDHLNRVIAGSLTHLANNTHGVPGAYARPDEDTDSAYERWVADLNRWALAFYEASEPVAIYDKPNYVKHRAEEDRRRNNLQAALAEMAPWWEALWD